MNKKICAVLVDAGTQVHSESMLGAIMISYLSTTAARFAIGGTLFISADLAASICQAATPFNSIIQPEQPGLGAGHFSIREDVVGTCIE